CVTVSLSCDGASRVGDTLGLQSLGRWEWHGRIVAEPDPTLTIARVRMDTSQGGGDVVLARYDFNPAVGEGDEYSLALGLELGRAHDLVPGKPYAFGTGPGQIAAHATVACLCRPLARLANRLHVTTRAGVIRRTLLVNPGDRYDSARVAESERALRSLFVFSRVRLDTTRIAGRLALRVTTSDGWSTKPQFGYSTA